MRAAESEWRHDLSEVGGTAASVLGEGGDGACPPAVVIDSGELQDVVDVMTALAPGTAHVRAEELLQLDALPSASRVFVTTARLAMSLGLAADAHQVSVAIADAGVSQTVVAAVKKLGFDYVIQRPVHPQALRLLLLQALFRGDDKRATDRVALGCDARWRSGWKLGRTVVTEISLGGCRILCREPVEVGARIRLKLALESGALRLKGRVLRRDPGSSRLDDGGGSLAIRFEKLSGRARERLARLVAELASGPVVRSRDERSPATEPAAGAHPQPARSEPAPAPAVRGGPVRPRPRPRPRVERRREPRGVLKREVVALDEVTHSVVHTLLGSDLSPSGMRIEPHNALRVGDRLRVALYDPERADPLVVQTEIVRDDGERGLLLRFTDPSPEVSASIARMLDSLPSVGSLDGAGAQPERVTVSEILLTDEV